MRMILLQTLVDDLCLITMHRAAPSSRVNGSPRCVFVHMLARWCCAELYSAGVFTCVGGWIVAALARVRLFCSACVPSFDVFEVCQL